MMQSDWIVYRKVNTLFTGDGKVLMGMILRWNEEVDQIQGRVYHMISGLLGVYWLSFNL